MSETIDVVRAFALPGFKSSPTESEESSLDDATRDVVKLFAMPGFKSSPRERETTIDADIRDVIRAAGLPGFRSSAIEPNPVDDGADGVRKAIRDFKVTGFKLRPREKAAPVATPPIRYTPVSVKPLPPAKQPIAAKPVVPKTALAASLAEGVATRFDIKRHNANAGEISVGQRFLTTTRDPIADLARMLRSHGHAGDVTVRAIRPDLSHTEETFSLSDPAAIDRIRADFRLIKE